MKSTVKPEDDMKLCPVDFWPSERMVMRAEHKCEYGNIGLQFEITQNFFNSMSDGDRLKNYMENLRKSIWYAYEKERLNKEFPKENTNAA